MDTIRAFKIYLEAEKHYSPHTVQAYINDLIFFLSFIEVNYEQNTLETVNYSQIRSWIVSLAESSLSNSTINRKVASLKAFYKFLYKTRQIIINPLAKHKVLKTPKKVQIPFSEKEIETVLISMNNSNNTFETIRNKLIIDILYTTGMRRAELIGLKTKNINFQNNTLKVLGKRNKERIIPVLSEIIPQISLYLEKKSELEGIIDQEFLFVTLKGNKLYDSFVYRLINHYFSLFSEKVKKSPHIMRHSFASHMLNSGADLNSVKELLGHSSLASTQIYTQSSLLEIKKVYKAAHPRENEY